MGKKFHLEIFLNSTFLKKEVSGCCVKLSFIIFLLLLLCFLIHITYIFIKSCSLDRGYHLQQHGSNRNILAQFIKKLWWCEGSFVYGCCEFSIFLVIFVCFALISPLKLVEYVNNLCHKKEHALCYISGLMAAS